MELGIVCVAVLVSLFAFPSTVRATGTPDQSQPNSGGCCPFIHGSQRMAQSFSAGISGNLDQVDLLIGRSGNPGPLTVDIRMSSGGAPSGSVLASETVAQENVYLDPTGQGVGDWVSVPLSPPAPSTAGVQYAIELSAPNANGFDKYVWRAGAGDPYSGGMAVKSQDGGASWSELLPGWDLAFKTYVTPPDQSQPNSGGCCPFIHGSQRMAQSFSAGISGNLDQVDLLIGRSGNPGPLTVDIRMSSGGAPSGSVLASETVAQENVYLDPTGQGVGDWVSVPLSPPAPSTAGVQYAIELSAPNANGFDKYVWRAGAGDPYSGGMAVKSQDGGASWSELLPGWDLAFKTYVTTIPPPDPPTLTDTDPDSPSIDNSPNVKGTAQPGTIVRIYNAPTAADCAGPNLAATGTAADFASTGLNVSVPSGSTTTFRATATDGGGTSDCSGSSITYVAETYDDEFTSPTLDPAWMVWQYTGPFPRSHSQSTPANDYSLSANPGRLRYLLYPMTHDDGFLNGHQTTFGYHSCCNHDAGLELQRSFGGSSWTFDTKVDYYIPNTNGRRLGTRIYLGDGSQGTFFVSFDRGRDVNANYLVVRLVQKTGSTLNDLTTVEQEVVNYDLSGPENDTKYFRLTRNGGVLTALRSDDGIVWTTSWSHDLGTQLDSLPQAIVLAGLSWFSSSGTYADYDYVRVTGDFSEPPAAPTLTATTPNPPANDNAPELIGTADAGTTVRLYRAATTVDCTGANLAATGTAADFASTGLSVSVANDSTTTFRATATDASGNSSGCSASSIIYTEDSTAPETTIDSGPSGPIDGPTATFEFSSNESGSSFECELDSAGPQACSSPKSYSDLSIGSHTFYVQATDQSGNTDASRSDRTFSVSGYARPKGASPTTVRLVPAFEECTSANAVHGEPLSSASCSPPVPASDFLTVGTPDANGKVASSTGYVALKVLGESPIDPNNGDQADVEITLQISDVRQSGDLTDYMGELEGVLTLRVTDRLNGAAEVSPATATDVPLRFAIGCTPTAGTEGGACNLTTTADAVMSGVAMERKRAIWELAQVKVFDGGADGDAGTADNTLFAVQGLFLP
jgi:hypothetical protein